MKDGGNKNDFPRVQWRQFDVAEPNKGQVPFTKKCVFDVATPSFLDKDLNFRNFFVTPLFYF